MAKLSKAMPINKMGRPMSALAVALSAEEWACIREIAVAHHAQVFKADGFRQALDQLYDRPADIIIASSELPDGTWKDILAATQQQPVPPPVIVVSRLADEHLWSEVLNLGGYDLIARPLESSQVEWMLMSALRHVSTMACDVHGNQLNQREAYVQQS